MKTSAQLRNVIENNFLKALAVTPLQKLSRLLVPVLLTTLFSRFPTQQLEVTGLLHEIDIGTFEGYGWASSVIAGLPSELGEELARWLKNWHDVRITCLMFSLPSSY